MHPSSDPPDIARHLDDQVRAQERQLVIVRLAVVALATGFLIVFGDPIDNRFALMGVVAGVAGYSLLIGVLLTRLATRPVAVMGVTLDALAVTAVVWLATNVPDAYLFYSIVILGAAIRFGMIASIALSIAIGVAYLAVVVGSPPLDARVGELLPVRILFLVTFGVVAGLFSRIIIGGVAENARLQQRLQAEELERARASERELLSRLGRDFSASLNRRATARAIVSGSAPLLGDATLLLRVADDELLVPVAAEGADVQLVARWKAHVAVRRPKSGEGIIGSAAATRTSQLGPGASAGGDADDVDELGVDWMLAVPVQVGGRLLGVLATAGMATRPVDEAMRRVAEALADRAGPALQNAQLWTDLQKRMRLEKEAQQVKDDFLSVVSHELRTPLTSIQGYSQLLEARMRAERGSSKEMGHVRVILSQVMRMRRLVDDLLDMNRIDRSGGVSIEPVDFDLADLLRDAVSRISRAETDRDIALTAPDSLAVHLDRDRIDQILGNLLENAVKYSPEGGPIRVAAVEHRHEVEVSVSDCGMGIPPDRREHVFERFYQTDDGQGLRRFGGLGLGLAISKAIVEAHGGRIWAAANEEAGRGSIITFRIPRTALPAAPGADDGDDAPSFVRRRDPS